MLQIRFMSRQRRELRDFPVSHLGLTYSLTGGALSAVHEGVEVVWSVAGREVAGLTLAEPPLVASVALTESPLTVGSEGAAAKALVVVVIVVVVVGVPAQAPQQQSVLQVSVVNLIMINVA